MIDIMPVNKLELSATIRSVSPIVNLPNTSDDAINLTLEFT
jgi:hypothetical protein